VDALVFDFDGLIVDTEWPAYVSVRDQFEIHGVELSLVQWQARIGRADNPPWTQLLEQHVGSIDVDAAEEARRRHKNAMTDAQPVLPGVVSLLDEAQSRGLSAAVASSSPSTWVKPHLERRGLLQRFGAVWTRDMVERGKPWPDLFLAASAALEVAPHRAIAFEDSVHGVTAAKDAGMFCVAVPNKVTAGGDFTKADLVVDTLADVTLSDLGL